jgi:hypothetical protein
MIKMKNITLGALVASFAIFPVQAQDQDYTNYDNVVIGGRSLDNFVGDVNKDLDRALNRSRPVTRAIMGTGIVQVLFECGPDGKPTNISYYRKDQDGDVNRLAVRAVSKIRTMHPLPHGVSENQQYMANIIIASNYLEYEDLSKELNRSEQSRIAVSKGSNKIFAFNQTIPVRRN